MTNVTDFLKMSNDELVFRLQIKEVQCNKLLTEKHKLQDENSALRLKLKVFSCIDKK